MESTYKFSQRGSLTSTVPFFTPVNARDRALSFFSTPEKDWPTSQPSVGQNKKVHFWNDIGTETYSLKYCTALSTGPL